MSGEYWQECVECALEDAGITATDEQVKIVVETVQGSHENYGMYHGHDCIPNPLALENEQLKKELTAEKDKVLCKECNGLGRITESGPYHSSESQCMKCKGEGRHSL